jgi:hypothetical protein
MTDIFTGSPGSRISRGAQTDGIDASGSVGLDSDTLLSYCAAQLDEMNGDIKSRLEAQQRVRDVKSAITLVKSTLNADPKHEYSPAEQEQILSSLATAIRETPPGKDRDALMAQLQTYRTQVCYGSGPDAPKGPPSLDGYLDPKGAGAKDGVGAGISHDVDASQQPGDNKKLLADPSAMQSALDQVGDDLGKNADLDMISLQDIVSKRQMAIQTTTQIMAKFSQSLETIGNNIK